MGDMLISLLRTFTMAKVYFRDMHSLLLVTISFYFDYFFILYHCFYCSDVNWKVVTLNSCTTLIKSCITDFVVLYIIVAVFCCCYNCSFSHYHHHHDHHRHRHYIWRYNI